MRASGPIRATGMTAAKTRTPTRLPTVRCTARLQESVTLGWYTEAAVTMAQ